MRVYSCLLAAGMLTAGACADTSAPTTTQNGTPFDLNIAALTLDGVSDAVWDIHVENGQAETVFEARITSSQYGDGKGSASYVGTCDASPDVSNNDGACDLTGGAGTGICTAGIAGTSAGQCDADADCDTFLNYNQNKIVVDIIGIYASTVATPGAYGSAAPAGSLDFQNPSPLQQTQPCSENGDTFVQFDVALMRPAQQGFFDIAVNFNDVFCSAKFDCNAQNLLLDTNGTRGPTTILGFACSAGTGADTQLLMQDLTISCNSGNDTYTLDVSAGDGNLCDAGSVATGSESFASNCTGLTSGAPLFQAAIYAGTESNGLVKYWNIALGTNANTPGDCHVTTRATADDNNANALTGQAVGAGQVYPYVDFDADLQGCGANAMTFDGSTDVQVTYTTTNGSGLSFSDTK